MEYTCRLSLRLQLEKSVSKIKKAYAYLQELNNARGIMKYKDYFSLLLTSFKIVAKRLHVNIIPEISCNIKLKNRLMIRVLI
jgi:short-subunit dehydrogenase involved in D-alanine esterification of teichoic acids